MAIGINGPVVDNTINFQSPTTGTTVTLNNGDYHVIIAPSGTLATLTVKMPATPMNFQTINVRFTQAITTLTVSANTGQSMANGSPTTIAAGHFFEVLNVNNTWYICT